MEKVEKQVEVDGTTFIYCQPTHAQRRKQAQLLHDMAEIEDVYGRMIASAEQEKDGAAVRRLVRERSEERLQTLSGLATMLHGIVDRAHRGGHQIVVDEDYWNGVVNEGLAGGEGTVFTALVGEVFYGLSADSGRSPSGKKKASETDSPSSFGDPDSPGPAPGAESS